MRFLVLLGVVSFITITTMAVYSEMIDPQLENLRQMYSSMDESAQNIVNNQTPETTATYKAANSISALTKQ